VESSDAPVRVVVVDDHPFYRDGVTRGLTNSGRIVVVAEVGDGRDALEVIRREQPDVALVDYEMPDIDGLGVVRAVIRDKLPTRVVLLSAHTDSGVVFRALEEGAAGYLARTRGAARSSRRSSTSPGAERSCPRSWRRGSPAKSDCGHRSSGPR
jgi:two-component system, NarL family, nitrate/nitrite response regulator NarL